MDSQLNNKSLLTLKVLGRIAVEMNPGILSGVQASVPSDKSPSHPTTTGVNTHHSSHSLWELYVSLGKMT